LSLSKAVSPDASVSQTQDMAKSTAGTVGSLLKGVNENVESLNETKPLVDILTIIEDCLDEVNCSEYVTLCMANKTEILEQTNFTIVNETGYEMEELTSDTKFTELDDYNHSTTVSTSYYSTTTSSPYLNPSSEWIDPESIEDILSDILVSGSTCSALEAVKCVSEFIGPVQMTDLYEVTQIFIDIPTEEDNCTTYLENIDTVDESAQMANQKVITIKYNISV